MEDTRFLIQFKIDRLREMFIGRNKLEVFLESSFRGNDMGKIPTPLSEPFRRTDDSGMTVIQYVDPSLGPSDCDRTWETKGRKGHGMRT